MKTLTLKRVSPELYGKLKDSARANRRSLNNEAIHRLESSLLRERIDPDEFLLRARALRQRLTGLEVTDDELRQAVNAGRP